MCSIVYEPCDENSFKIGPPIGGQNTDEGSGYGAMEDWTDECSDKVLMPCDSEEFITVQYTNVFLAKKRKSQNDRYLCTAMKAEEDEREGRRSHNYAFKL